MPRRIGDFVSARRDCVVFRTGLSVQIYGRTSGRTDLVGPSGQTGFSGQTGLFGQTGSFAQTGSSVQTDFSAQTGPSAFAHTGFSGQTDLEEAQRPGWESSGTGPGFALVPRDFAGSGLGLCSKFGSGWNLRYHSGPKARLGLGFAGSYCRGSKPAAAGRAGLLLAITASAEQYQPT